MSVLEYSPYIKHVSLYYSPWFHIEIVGNNRKRFWNIW